MEAKTILLQAFGESEESAVSGAIEGPIMAGNLPSILQMVPQVKVSLDKEAARPRQN